MTGEYKNMIKGIMAITAVMLLAAAALGRMAYYAGAGTAAFNLSLLFVTAQTLVILGAYILWYRKTSQEAEDMMNIVDKRRMAYHYKNKYILISVAATGGIALAEKVLETLEKKESHFHVLYEDSLSLTEKIGAVAKEIYGADGVVYSPAAKKQLARLAELGFSDLPVCMAKTQYSLSDNPALLGRPEHFEISVREAYVSAGAGFVVVLTGAVMTMPGLPKTPAAFRIDVDEDGRITGLF